MPILSDPNQLSNFQKTAAAFHIQPLSGSVALGTPS